MSLAKVKTSNQPDYEYKGEPLDDELANGPLQKRSCTDLFCCLLFIVFLGGVIGVAGWAINQGNPNLVGRGYDTDGKICGISAGYENYPYLYWTVPESGYLAQTVCVSSCPTSPLPNSVDCKFNTLYSTSASCTGPNTDSSIAAGMASGSQTGKIYIYDSIPFVDRFCVPKAAETFAAAAANDAFNSDLLTQWISDIKSTWQVIAVSLAVAFVIGLVYMILLRWCSGVLTWLAILCFTAGTAILGWRFYQHAQQDVDNTASTSSQSSSSSTSKQTVEAEKIIAYICWGVSGFTVLAVVCLFNRIRLAIAIMKAASDYVRDTLSVFLVPIVTVLILVTFFVFWSITAVYLVSAGNTSQIAGTAFGTFTFNQTLKKLLIYHLFGLLWFNAFVLAAVQFIVASSVCLWYFSQGTGQGASKTVRTSIYRLFRYHIGSIAFGSLILALIQLARIILAYMQAQAKKMAGKESKVIQFVLGCMQCYLTCFEKVIKFLNKNAYIQIALTGKSFCGAAKDAFYLVFRNPLRFGVVGTIGSIFVLFGKVFVAALTALGAFLVITKWSKFNDNVYSPFIPTLLVFVFAYAIGGVFMTVYGLAGDTILACFVCDEELQKKKNAPPRHCPESLKDFIEKRKKI